MFETWKRKSFKIKQVRVLPDKANFMGKNVCKKLKTIAFWDVLTFMVVASGSM